MSKELEIITALTAEILAILPKTLDKDTVILGDSRNQAENTRRLVSIIAHDDNSVPHPADMHVLHMRLMQLCEYCNTYLLNSGRLVPNSIKQLRTLGYTVHTVKWGDCLVIAYLQLPVGRVMFYCNELLSDELIELFTSVHCIEEEPMQQETVSDVDVKQAGSVLFPVLSRIAGIINRKPKGKRLFTGK